MRNSSLLTFRGSLCRLEGVLGAGVGLSLDYLEGPIDVEVEGEVGLGVVRVDYLLDGAWRVILCRH